MSVDSYLEKVARDSERANEMLARIAPADDVVDAAVAALDTDPGALFEVVDKLRDIRESDPARYARIRAKAKGARVSVTELDRLTATASADAGGGNVMFDDVEPWPDPVNGIILLDAIVEELSRYVVADVATLRAAALWSVHTWQLDVVSVSPIANITAPEKRCGKTVTLTALGKLAYRPLQASNIAPAALFRSIEMWGPTLLIDEVDSFLASHEEARGIINSGFDRAGAYVIRCVGDAHEPTKFSTWGAKALCGIGRIADTLEDRSIPLRLRRKLPGEVALNIRHSDPTTWEELRAQIARWTDDNRESVRSSRPEPIKGLHDRANDCWEPLRAIAEAAGGDWPNRARQAALALHGVEDQDRSVGVELLADIKASFDRKGCTRLFTGELLEALTADDEAPWATWNRGKPMTARQLATRLDEFKVASADKRKNGQVRKGFDLEQFTDAFARYLFSPDPPALSATTLQPKPSKGFSGKSSATPGGDVADENSLKGKPSNVCSVVADTDPLPGKEKPTDPDEVLL